MLLFKKLLRRGVACGLVLGLAAVAVQSRAAVTETFASVMKAAMARMDHDMMMPASGDTDRDFATMMIPHHQGAVEMAEAELRFGRDPVLRRLAQGIVVEQQQEIAVMRRAIVALPASSASQPNPTLMHKGH